MAKSRGSVRSDSDVHLAIEIINSEADDIRQHHGIWRYAFARFFRRIPGPGNWTVISIPRPRINLGWHSPQAKITHAHAVRFKPNPCANLNQVWTGETIGGDATDADKIVVGISWQPHGVSGLDARGRVPDGAGKLVAVVPRIHDRGQSNLFHVVLADCA